MITPPGASQLGQRLTIALRDSHGNTAELLGVLQDKCTIKKRDGSLATFDPDSITHWRVVTEVSKKAGFGAPLSMRIRDLESAAATTWPADTTAEFGKWLLRASKDNPLLQNSALPTGARPFGEPGMEIESALINVEDFYRSNALPLAITVPLPAYTQLDEYLEKQGWNVAAEYSFMVIDTSDLQPLIPHQHFTINISQEPTDAWFAIQGQELSDNLHRYPANYLTILVDGQSVASGRIAFNGDWGVITHVFVKSGHRQQGIGRLILHALADTAREQNCRKLTLQVDSNDSAAVSLCESLRFRFHHRDRCRVPTTHQFPDSVI
jgi:GNAT superfamily N-acetyltransferase